MKCRDECTVTYKKFYTLNFFVTNSTAIMRY